MSDLRQRIANLSPEKRALLELRLMQQGSRAAEVETIAPRSQSGPCPLSFAQQRLWFLTQLDPDGHHYNESKVLRLSGALNVPALHQALNGIIARHEVLRTTFTADGEYPVQVVAAPREISLPVIDLSAHPAAERDAEMRRQLIEAMRCPFDMSCDLMLRATLIRLGDAEHVLLLVIHHIASDGWSMGILSRELSILYNALCTGSTPQLPPLPIQYADYALWQREYLQAGRAETLLAYWRQQLAGAPTMLELPTDRPRPAVQTYRGAHRSFVLPETLAQALKVLSRQEGVTLFMLLLAAFQTLLYRYTGQTDIVVGSPIAGRTRRETEGLIGFFVNMLVLRTDLADMPSFRGLLRRVREVALGAYAHQDVPFETLVEELQPARHLSHNPLFQVGFAHQNVPRSPLELHGLTVTPVEIESGTAKFDLSVAVREEARAFQGTVEYNTDLFDAATIERMVGHFQTLLAGIVANPDQRLSELPLLSAQERQQLLVAWNPPMADAPSMEVCLHHLFDAQVERTPEAIAVVCEDAQLTYRELQRRANQLAHHLQTFGVGPETLVGLCVERSLDIVVGLLGILKAGGAFVPLDPLHPKERLAFMRADAQIAVLLTQERLRAHVAGADTQVICLDTDWRTIAAQSTANPCSEVTVANVAYAMYTSGSTGEPKGVLVSHQAIVYHCHSIQTAYALQARDRVLQFAALTFDPCIEQIFPTLAVGATVVLRDASVWTVTELQQHLNDAALSVINLPPVYWHQLVEAWAKTPTMFPPSHLRLAIIGGDVLSPEVLRLWKGLPRHTIRVLNAYGPTEGTITSTIFDLASLGATETLPHSIPIGRPLANRHVYILDAHRNPVPIGVPGELYIGGSSLARGYLRRPELTAKSFLPDPFSQESQARLYRTGDRVRFLADGSIEFLGRLDTQVKIRGIRIELREIEAILQQHPAVQETVVVVREDTPGEKRIVAYLVAHQQPCPPASELRRFLQHQLPEYMVPTIFVELDVLPLMSNGKIDRQALPMPDASHPSLEAAFVAPRTSIEAQVVTMWQELLGHERVGIHDNFFALGGHSLLLTQLIMRIRNRFQVEIPLRSLYETPTVAGLVAIITERQAPMHSAAYTVTSSASSCLITLQDEGEKPPLFVAEGVGYATLFRDLARHLGNDQPVYGLQYPGLEGYHEPVTRVEDIAETFIRDICSIQPHGPYYLAGLCFGGVVMYEVAQQLLLCNQSVAVLIMFDAFAPSVLQNVSWPQRLGWSADGFLQWERQRQLECLRETVASAWERLTQYVESYRDSVHAGHRPTSEETVERIRRANKHARQRYQPRPYPGRIILVQAMKRNKPWRYKHVDPLHGWGSLAQGGIELIQVNGRHRKILMEPKVGRLARRLLPYLLEAQATPVMPKGS